MLRMFAGMGEGVMTAVAVGGRAAGGGSAGW